MSAGIETADPTVEELLAALIDYLKQREEMRRQIATATDDEKHTERADECREIRRHVIQVQHKVGARYQLPAPLELLEHYAEDCRRRGRAARIMQAARRDDRVEVPGHLLVW